MPQRQGNPKKQGKEDPGSTLEAVFRPFLMLFGPRIPFCAADALWEGVTHTFGQISKHVGSPLGAYRAL